MERVVTYGAIRVQPSAGHRHSLPFLSLPDCNAGVFVDSLSQSSEGSVLSRLCHAYRADHDEIRNLIILSPQWVRLLSSPHNGYVCPNPPPR